MTDWQLRKDAGWDKSYSDGYMDGQRKLLEYLVAHPDKGEWTEEEKQDCIKIRTLKLMLKELEKK